MKIFVSACLLGENCKYNGGNNINERAIALRKGYECIPVCPEVMGGLPVPRTSAEVNAEGIVYTEDGRNVDSYFQHGALKCLELARMEKPAFCLLQSRSPSCGVYQRYDGTFTGTLINGSGVTAACFLEQGIPCMEPSDIFIEGSLCIRRSIPLDHQRLQDLFYKIRKEEFPWEKDVLREDFDRSTQGEAVYIAENDGIINGFISIWEEDAFIHNLFVDKQARAMKVGHSLLMFVRHRYPDRTLTLKCVKENKNACQFYLEHGWKITGDYDGEVPYYLMQC